MRATVLVVAKAPVPGRAKTRLTPPLTAAQSADVAAAALLDTLEAATGAAHRLGRARPVVALTGELGRAARHHELRRLLRACRVVPQRGDGFDARLVAAHEDASGAGPVVQVGMDTPQLTADGIVDCVDRLRREGADAVLGPAPDGGWWVLACAHPRWSRALAGVPMSTRATHHLTRDALRAAGASVVTAPALRDVDTVDDALAVARVAPGTRFAASLAVAMAWRAHT